MNPVCYGLMLIPLVMSKLPEYFKLTTTQKFGQDLWDIKLILESNFSCVFYHQKHKPQHRKTMTKIEKRIFVVGMFSETVLKVSLV